MLFLDAKNVATGEAVRGVFAPCEVRIKPIRNTNRALFRMADACEWVEIEIVKLSRL